MPPFLPFDDDFETSAFFSYANNIEAEMAVPGTKRSYAFVHRLAASAADCQHNKVQRRL
jgi:hypothetical protein